LLGCCRTGVGITDLPAVGSLLLWQIFDAVFQNPSFQNMDRRSLRLVVRYSFFISSECGPDNLE